MASIASLTGFKLEKQLPVHIFTVRENREKLQKNVSRQLSIAKLLGCVMEVHLRGTSACKCRTSIEQFTIQPNLLFTESSII